MSASNQTGAGILVGCWVNCHVLLDLVRLTSKHQNENEMALPVTIGKDLAPNVLSHHSPALQVHKHTADGRLLRSLQLFLTQLACYCLLHDSQSSHHEALMGPAALVRREATIRPRLIKLMNRQVCCQGTNNSQTAEMSAGNKLV